MNDLDSGIVLVRQWLVALQPLTKAHFTSKQRVRQQPPRGLR
jgi:hypothetical protein